MRSSRILPKITLFLALLLTETALADQCPNPLHAAQPWSEDQISASRRMDVGYNPVNAPIWNAGPMNITLVVESGDHHISVLDSDKFAVLDRFATPVDVYTDPQFSPDGRYAYILSCDGWVQKYDIWALQQVGRVRAGLRARNMAISADGKWLAVANSLPTALTILATDNLLPTRVIKIKGGDDVPSRLSGVYNNPLRESFILALLDVPKIWEVFYGSNPPAFGFAHDWRSEGPVPHSDPFPIRKITTPDILGRLGFDPSYEYVAGAALGGNGVVMDLVIGLIQTDLKLSAAPDFSAGVHWKQGGENLIAIPHQNGGVVTVINMNSWEVIKRITLDGPVLSVSSHGKSKYLWVDMGLGPERDLIQLIDKQSLKVVKTVRPPSGATLAHVAFSKDGSKVLVSVRGNAGAIIIYDANTMQKIVRLPMRKPLGIYNVWSGIKMPEIANQ